jgi:monovalent cation:H+ antiporter, CPA1 family
MTHLPAAASEVAIMLSVIIVISVLTARLRMPYTVGLVVAGLIVGILPHPQNIELTPSLVLFLFLPPLLFDGGWSADTKELGRNWAPITLLATVGVLLGIGLSYAFLVFGARLPAPTAIIFGAIVAATDPVAVLALFKALRIDPGLLAIVEGESLFNDGTSVVAFSALMAVFALGGGLRLGATLWDFTLMTVGGIAIGVAIGYLARLIIRLVADQTMVVAFVTASVAYGAYFIADDLGVSGIMAVIFAAIVISASTSLSRTSAEDRAQIGGFWSVIAFLANSALFLLMGASIHIRDIVTEWPVAIWGVLAVVIGRPLMVRLLAPISALLGRPLTPTWQNAITLAGMRGALSMALVLSLPDDFPNRSLLISMVFSVVLFTIVVQGSLLEPLLRMMGLTGVGTTAPPQQAGTAGRPS